MKKYDWLIAMLALVIISFIYFPTLIEGKVLKAQDSIMHKGMSKEIVDYQEKHGEPTLWSNRYFGGGPSFLITASYKNNFVGKLLKPILKIPRPASYLFLAFILFFVLLKTLKVNTWLSFVGSLAFGMHSTFFIWVDTGHMTKALTMTFMAGVMAGVLLAYNRKMVLGSVIASISFSWMINAGHPQITYYAGIMAIVLAITYFVYAVKDKTIQHFIKVSAILIVGAFLAVGTNYSRLATTMEYGKYSTRGQSELTDESGNQTSGLDKDYILDYSYDMAEAVSAFIPRFKGGGNMESLDEKSSVYKFIAPHDKKYAKNFANSLPLYWGSQPISAAPFYFGAVLVFLFVFGLFVLKGKDKWWLAITVLVAFLLSLGKYFPALSNIMLDYFPGYNKFRDVKNIIVIQQFAMALLGVLAIREVALRKITDKEFLKSLKYSFAISGGFALIFALIPNLAGDFSGASDSVYASRTGIANLPELLQEDRKMVLRSDAFRTFIFVSLAALTLLGFWKKKLKPEYALVIWGVLIMADMWPINKKYLNNDDFESKRKAKNPVEMTAADKAILQDKSLNYRVLNLTVNPFSDGTTSYFHNSLGGYHGAKLQRYQELITHGISPEMMEMQRGFSNVKSQADVDNLFSGLGVLNMLNTKYIIHNPQAAPILNNNTLGNAWFVDSYKVVENSDEEIALINAFNPAAEALVDKRYNSAVDGLVCKKDSTASIKLVEYQPNYLKYESNNAFDALAIFSEIYYPAGWNATINGKSVDIIRANYVLRGLNIPAGKNVIEFSFKPKTFYQGEMISLASSIILILIALGVGLHTYMQYNQKKTNKAI